LLTYKIYFWYCPSVWNGIRSIPIVTNNMNMKYIIIMIVITTIDFSLGGSSPYTSTDKINKNKYI